MAGIFNGLEEHDLRLQKTIYEMPFSDPDDKTARMLNKLSLRVYLPSIEKTNIPMGDRAYRPCIMVDYIGDKAHLTFHSYFYELLQNYCSTNDKRSCENQHLKPSKSNLANLYNDLKSTLAF